MRKRQAPEDQHTLLPLLLGAVAGATLVVGMVAALGGVIEGLAALPVLAVFAIAGAIFGALAWGAVSYDRRTRAPSGRPS